MNRLPILSIVGALLVILGLIGGEFRAACQSETADIPSEGETYWRVILETARMLKESNYPGAEAFIAAQKETLIPNKSKLFDQLRTATDPDIRYAVSLGLGLMLEPEDTQILLSLLDENNQGITDVVRGLLMSSVKEFGKPVLSDVIAALDRYVQEKKDNTILARSCLCNVLGEFPQPEAIPIILRALEDRNFATQHSWWAEVAIKKCGVSGIDYVVRYIGENETTTASGSPSYVHVDCKARILVWSLIVTRYHLVEDREILPSECEKRYTKEATLYLDKLRERLNGGDEASRLGAALCLVRFGDSDAAEYLLTIAQAHDHGLPRFDVIEGLGYARSREAIPILRKLLLEPDLRYATAATVALGRVGSNEATDDLILIVKETLEAKSDEGFLLGKMAAYALGQIGDPRALPILLEAARPRPAPQEYRRPVPILALGHFPEEEALSMIVSGLSSNRLEVRCAAVRALGTRADTASVDWLIKTLNHEDAFLHSFAAEQLGFIGDKRAVPAILPLLTRPEWNSRLRAPEALVRIGDPSAIPALKEALEAPVNKKDYSVRNKIQKAIKSLEGTR